MKIRNLLFVLMLFLICLTGFGQKTNVPSKDTTNTIEVSISALQDSIQHLLLTNQSQQKQIDELNKKVTDSIADYNDKMSHWLALFAIVLAIFSIIIPHIMNSKSEKYMSKILDDAKKEANEARAQATSAQVQVGEAKQQAISAKKQVDEAKQQVTSAKEQVDEAKQQVTKTLKQVNEAKLQASLAQEHAQNAKHLMSEVQEMKDQISKIQNTTKMKK